MVNITRTEPNVKHNGTSIDEVVYEIYEYTNNEDINEINEIKKVMFGFEIVREFNLEALNIIIFFCGLIKLIHFVNYRNPY